MFEQTYKELALHKLILLYILKKVDAPISNSQLTQVIVDNDLMNYFSFQQFISELTESKLVKKNNKEFKDYYVLFEKGSQVLSYFEDRIDDSIKSKINSYIDTNKHYILRDTNIKCSILQNETLDEFISELIVSEGDVELINIKLNVPSRKQADLVCNNWKKNAETIYADLLKIIVPSQK